MSLLGQSRPSNSAPTWPFVGCCSNKRQTQTQSVCPKSANHVMACVVLNERGTMVARRITTSSGSPISQIGMRIAVHAAWGGVINWGEAMPTDLLAAMARKAELRKQQQ